MQAPLSSLDCVFRQRSDLIYHVDGAGRVERDPHNRYYVRHWQIYRHDVVRSRRLLESHGCRRGSGGIYVCRGERLSFQFATTTGNPTRQLAFTILHEQLQRVGIELVLVFAHPVVFFGQIVNPGRFDIVLFTFVNSADPIDSVETWRCRGSQNYTGYCDTRVDRLLLRSNLALQADTRASLLNQADALIAQGLLGMPLFEKPAVVAFKSKLHGVVVNDTDEGWLWNAGDWWLSQ